MHVPKNILTSIFCVVLLSLTFIACHHHDDPVPAKVEITNISPSSGPVGTVVTITGTRFSTTISENIVKFNGLTATVTAATSMQLTVTVPTGATTGAVSVTVNGQSATGPQFTVKQVVVSTFAGNGQNGYVDGTGSQAEFNNPASIAIDQSGNFYVADESNHCIRKISPSGVVSLFAGSGNPSQSGIADGQGIGARFYYPTSVAVDQNGNVYVTDFANNRIRKITSGGLVSTLAGSTDGYQDGQGTAAKFSGPSGIDVDKINGNIYVADFGNDRIRKITSGGLVSTIAGSSEGFADGQGTAAKFSIPNSLRFDQITGNIYVSDGGNNRIRKISPTGLVSTIAGGDAGFADGQGTDAKFNYPMGLAIDQAGNIFIADNVNYRIRKITPSGFVTTYAGSGTKGFAEGNASSAKFSGPTDLVADPSGNLFVADYRDHRIRKISLQ